MINLNQVGARASRNGAGNWEIAFGLHLPGLTPAAGYAVKVRVIHEKDQFLRAVEPRDFALTWISAPPYDVWLATVPLAPIAGTHFGQEGQYLYRYQLLRNGEEVALWFADPFARAAGLGTLSAVTVDSGAVPFPWSDATFQVPDVDDMIVYELNVREFNRTFQGVIDQLGYLEGLGVNVLELMPVTNVKEDVEWGYTPLGYFAPDERLGGVDEFKRMVDACHERGIAVILDAVYAHAHPEFAYDLVYRAAGEPSPMMGDFAGEFFEGRPGTDYSKAFTRDYFLAVNRHWLEEFHIDGFRYDYVPGMYIGPAKPGYADLVYQTYQLSRPIPRFQTATARSRIIQCAEHLPNPVEILSKTYSNCAWQNGLLDRARDMARHQYVTHHIAHQLDPELQGYPSEFRDPASGESFPVAPLQYLESHDHPRFINEFGAGSDRDLLGQPYGNRSRFYKTQPYVIGLFTGKGIPMIWNGQEFGENWGIPSWGIGRNLFERPLHWEYFYDRPGKALMRLYRQMGTLRRRHRALGSRGYFYYYHDPAHLAQGVIVYRREAAAAPPLSAEILLIALNFSDRDATVRLDFPQPGRWTEQIDGTRPPINVTPAALSVSVTIPSNYGAVYLLT